MVIYKEGIRVILGKASFRAVRVATRASLSFWVGAGGRATAGGDTICSRGFLLTKARYCSMVSLGGVDTGKSNIQREREEKGEKMFFFYN